MNFVNCEAPNLVDVWNHAVGPQFHIRKTDLNWNLQDQDLVRYRIVKIRNVDCLIGESSEIGSEMGIAGTQLWVSLWSPVPTDAVDLFIGELLSLAEEKKKKRLMFGADEFHFFPGIPINEPAMLPLLAAIKRNEFRTAESADYTGDLNAKNVTDIIQRSLDGFKSFEFSFEEAVEEKDLNDLSAFLLREFPGRWHRELKVWRARKDIRRAHWLILRNSEKNILGFSRLAKRGDLLPLDLGWTPGALRLPLSQRSEWFDSDCCLGPIGVASAERGRGIGNLLLGLVLQALRQKGGDRICIDWTNAFKYYEPLGFEKPRIYWTAWKDLAV